MSKKTITFEMLRRRLATVWRYTDGIDDCPAKISINERLIPLTSANFAIDDDGTLLLTVDPSEIVAPSEITPRSEVYAAIDGERDFQDAKWGTIEQHPHEVGAWATIIRKLCMDMDQAWSSARGDAGALEEMRKLVAVGVACMEQHGVPKRSRHRISDPIPEPEIEVMQKCAGVRYER